MRGRRGDITGRVYLPLGTLKGHFIKRHYLMPLPHFADLNFVIVKTFAFQLAILLTGQTIFLNPRRVELHLIPQNRNLLCIPAHRGIKSRNALVNRWL